MLLLDENLAAASIVARLRDNGIAVKTVSEEFGRGTKDVDWLPVAGERGYVVVTKDRAIRRTPMEMAIVRDSRVLYFALTRGNMTSEQMSAAILVAWPHITRIVRSGKGRRAVMAQSLLPGA